MVAVFAAILGKDSPVHAPRENEQGWKRPRVLPYGRARSPKSRERRLGAYQFNCRPAIDQTVARVGCGGSRAAGVVVEFITPGGIKPKRHLLPFYMVQFFSGAMISYKPIRIRISLVPNVKEVMDLDWIN